MKAYKSVGLVNIAMNLKFTCKCKNSANFTRPNSRCYTCMFTQYLTWNQRQACKLLGYFSEHLLVLKNAVHNHKFLVLCQTQIFFYYLGQEYIIKWEAEYLTLIWSMQQLLYEFKQGQWYSQCVTSHWAVLLHKTLSPSLPVCKQCADTFAPAVSTVPPQHFLQTVVGAYSTSMCYRSLCGKHMSIS